MSNDSPKCSIPGQYLPQVAEYNDLIQRRILESECLVYGMRQYASLRDYVVKYNIVVKPSTDEIRVSLVRAALKQLNHTSSTPATLQRLVTEILKSAPDDMRASLQFQVGGKQIGGIRAAGTPAGAFTTMISDALRGKKGPWRIDTDGNVVPR